MLFASLMAVSFVFAVLSISATLIRNAAPRISRRYHWGHFVGGVCLLFSVASLVAAIVALCVA